MQRLSDWQTRLHAYLTSCRARRFEWGRWDCCLFVCDAVQVVTGTDPAAAFRGEYQSCLGALRAIHYVGDACTLEGVVRRVTAALGMAEVRPSFAQRGDVVLVGPPHDCLALVGLRGEILAATEQGLAEVPAQFALRAWRV